MQVGTGKERRQEGGCVSRVQGVSACGAGVQGEESWRGVWGTAFVPSSGGCGSVRVAHQLCRIVLAVTKHHHGADRGGAAEAPEW